MENIKNVAKGIKELEDVLVMRENKVSTKIKSFGDYFYMICETLVSKKIQTYLLIRDKRMEFKGLFNFENLSEFEEDDIFINLEKIRNINCIHIEGNEEVLNEEYSIPTNRENFCFPFLETNDIDWFSNYSSRSILEEYLEMFNLKIWDVFSVKKIFKEREEIIKDLLLGESEITVSFISSSITSNSLYVLDTICDGIEKIKKSSKEDSLYFSSKTSFKQNKEIFIEMLILILEEYSSRREEGKISFKFKEINLSVEHVINNEFMASKNYINLFLTNYRDYLSMRKDLKDSFPDNKNLRKVNLRPKDIFIAHDKAMSLHKLIKESVLDKRIERRSKRDVEIGDFIIRYPNSSKDFIYEGDSLSHCVSSYARRHAEGTTNIVFIRKREFPDEPYFTLEYKDKKIYQLRGKFNISAPDEITNIAKKFLEKSKIREAV